MKSFKAFRKDQEFAGSKMWKNAGFISIISLRAETFEDAREQAQRQLSKPGRDAYLQAWIDDGKLIGMVDANGNLIGDPLAELFPE